ncbi:MAG: hypothetical protein A4E45_02050 [Methanosaeta sp. PtaB.Bin039]|nr:MAG: hypothetical protein A4E45_02050 [Methanosaeta sp. PtaB.Bin039]OPY45669.1 MAG: hypothetical protein A4E47_00888 [Methanosaeta sp. PtaU1.Bin028]HOT06569.1 nucleotidyltransferase domain-containing protein [Methanotrichaceae archaeon]HQF16549.1 nucleotidyltransferase domain-containing protein [Methanotrichaceae archaeon]HQI91080.1 nucleotidyltransferase domain-containing protein [Methanotrichaceae archaeon]
MRARIRDFVRTNDDWIFAVADYVHPDGLRCLLRYVPDPGGEREMEGQRFRKVDFEEAFTLLRKEKPSYVKDLHIVPAEDVKRIYRPHEELSRTAATDSRLAKIVGILEEGGIPREQMGITGSMLLGLHGHSSDIDFVVYGEHWWQARDIISQAKMRGEIQELDRDMWLRIYNKRKPEISFQEFVAHEQRKGNRGMLGDTYFDLLFTRDWEQISPRTPGQSIGRKKMVAQVTEAALSFDAPAIFKLDGEIGELLCFSHTYAGQALPGETIEASGVLEETADGLRLVVGTTREARGEWIRSLTLLREQGLI